MGDLVHIPPLQQHLLEFCGVCRARITPLKIAQPRACARWECKLEMKQRKRASSVQAACRYCLLPLNAHQALRGACIDEHCQKALLHSNMREQSELEVNAFERQVQDLKSALARSKAPPPRLVQVPSFKNRMETVSAARKALFVEHVLAQFDALDNGEAKPSEPAAPFSDVAPPVGSDGPGDDQLIAACRTCRGHCCRNGNEHAYLKPESLRLRMEEHPDKSRDEIISTYTSFIGREAIAGSCVFHGLSGCTMPGDWRSRTCNTFFCKPVKQFIQTPVDENRDVVFIAVSHLQIERAARIVRQDYQVLDWPESDRAKEEGDADGDQQGTPGR